MGCELWRGLTGMGPMPTLQTTKEQSVLIRKVRELQVSGVCEMSVFCVDCARVGDCVVRLGTQK